MFNWLAIVIAVAVAFGLGGLWYMVLFSKIWSKHMGMDFENMDKDKEAKMKQGAMKGYVITIITSILTALVFSYLLQMMGVSGDYMAGLRLGFLAWAGFMLPLLTGSVTWGGKPMQLFYIDSSFWLVNMLLMGGILGFWA